MNSEQTYFFVGIKGTGMSSLALILHDKGYKVLGSDIDKYTFTQRGLENAGIKILPFDEDNIKEDMIVVAGNAFVDDQVEIKKAHDMGLTVQTYPETVEQIIEETTSIGVAGAHGKTSTSGLLAHVLSGVSPTSYLVGDGSGKGTPNARFFVFEADEYRRHFLAYHPDYQIMTNIDFDHPDYFKDQADYTSAFQSAADQTKKALFVWGDDKRLQSLKTDIPKYTYGFKDTDDFQAVDIKKSTTGSKFHVLAHGKDLGEFEIHLFGDHSILNSTAVIAVAYTEKVPMDDIREGMLTFKGAKRRFSEKDFGDIAVIDDYAHHPTEMRATIQAARQKFPDKKLVVVFQPHTFSRTKKYQKDFEEILRDVDKAYVTPIYASAREANGDISSEDLVKNIPGSEVIDLDNIADLTKNKNSVIVFMGAGDIPKYEDAFEKLL